jgi:DNA adenine methylase
MTKLKAPFPYFGGKSRVADIVWQRFGDTPNYVEPFCGSAAMLLGRPESHTGKFETINDKDGMVANFWRAVQNAPEEVAKYADWPVNENDFHARHAWLVSKGRSIVSRLEGDYEFYDARIAGWWVWGMALCIRGAWCRADGSWHSVNGALVKGAPKGGGISRIRPQLGTGNGIKAQWCEYLPSVLVGLAERLKNVRVCSGGWDRVLTNAPTTHIGLTAVFLDPPYTAEAYRAGGLYAKDSLIVGHKVAKWAIDNGDNPQFRIALCGYEGEYEIPSNWECVSWKSNGSLGKDGAKSHANRHRERIWFSPHCLKPETITKD